MRIAVALIVLALTGCAHDLKVAPPKIVQVEVPHYVPIPDELTKPCPVYEPQEQTYAEAKRLALLRMDSLLQCNKDKARIRALGGQQP